MSDIKISGNSDYSRDPKIIKHLQKLGIKAHLPTPITGKVVKRHPLPGQMSFEQDFLDKDARND